MLRRVALLLCAAALGGCATTGYDTVRVYDEEVYYVEDAAYDSGDGYASPAYLDWPAYYSVFWGVNRWYYDPFVHPGYHYGVTYYPRSYWAFDVVYGDPWSAARWGLPYSPYRGSMWDWYYDWTPWAYGGHHHWQESRPRPPRFGSARNEAERLAWRARQDRRLDDRDRPGRLDRRSDADARWRDVRGADAGRMPRDRIDPGVGGFNRDRGMRDDRLRPGRMQPGSALERPPQRDLRPGQGARVERPPARDGLDRFRRPQPVERVPGQAPRGPGAVRDDRDDRAPVRQPGYNARGAYKPGEPASAPPPRSVTPGQRPGRPDAHDLGRVPRQPPLQRPQPVQQRTPMVRPAPSTAPAWRAPPARTEPRPMPRETFRAPPRTIERERPAQFERPAQLQRQEPFQRAPAQRPAPRMDAPMQRQDAPRMERMERPAPRGDVARPARDELRRGVRDE